MEDETVAADATALEQPQEVIEIDDQEEEEDDECCICQENLHERAMASLPDCDHEFHYDCILTWAKVTNLCPLCKQKFSHVTQLDAHSGAEVLQTAVPDVKQVVRPDAQNTAEWEAQMRRINEARCEICGTADHEHVLLLCEAPSCPVAMHTYCIGLNSVPNHAWYCRHHESRARSASDLINRLAATVSARRRSRRVASLMSDLMSGRQIVARANRRRGTRTTASRARGGAARANELDVFGFGGDHTPPARSAGGYAAAYAMRMSRELQRVQERADIMFARGELTQPMTTTTPSLPLRAASSSHTDQLWQDFDQSRRELEAASAEAIGASTLSVGAARSPIRNSTPARITKDFVASYRDLAKRMNDAVSHDDYASSVSLMIPKTAKLGLVSHLKTFFAALRSNEQTAVLEMGCLSVLYSWIPITEQERRINAPNPQVLEAVITILEGLPVRKEHLQEAVGFCDALEGLITLPSSSLEMRSRIQKICHKWRTMLAPPAPVSAVPPSLSYSSYSTRTANSAPSPPALPAIRAFTSQKRPAPLSSSTSSSSSASHKRKREDNWSTPALEYVKSKLHPLYKQGPKVMSKDRFKTIVKQVLELFKRDAASMQSALVSPDGSLTNIAKTRLKALIDQVYKASASQHHRHGLSSSTAATAAEAAPSSRR